MYYLHFVNNTVNPNRKQYRAKIPKSRRDALVENKLKNQHYSCYWCGTNVDITAHLDHIKPIYYGGTSNRGNLVVACKDCNLIKSYDQIEITNQNTINDYKKLVKWYRKYHARPWAHKAKEYNLYKAKHAYAFRKI